MVVIHRHSSRALLTEPGEPSKTKADGMRESDPRSFFYPFGSENLETLTQRKNCAQATAGAQPKRNPPA